MEAGGKGLAASPGHSQILSRSHGEKLGCEIKSGSGLGTRLGRGACYHMRPSHISSEHAALFGLSSLCSLSRRWGRENGSTPG